MSKFPKHLGMGIKPKRAGTRRRVARKKAPKEPKMPDNTIRGILSILYQQGLACHYDEKSSHVDQAIASIKSAVEGIEELDSTWDDCCRHCANKMRTDILNLFK